MTGGPVADAEDARRAGCERSYGRCYQSVALRR